MNTQTREQWLLAATDKLRGKLFASALPEARTNEKLAPKILAEVPKVRVSVGFPSSGGTGSRRKAIGQYWPASRAADGVPQVFISPVLFDTNEVLATLVHELVHAVTPGTGHKAPFKHVALAVGLEGKMTATKAGEGLSLYLTALAGELGSYPHGALDPSSVKKQGTRLLKVFCTDCGYTCRVTSKWLDEVGTPLCPCNSDPMSAQ